MLKKNSVVLFQGDSITDCGREYDDYSNLGQGYPQMIGEYLNTFYSELNLTVVNKAISGNRVVDLQGRWEKDCIDINPDYLSILIGVNDTWRKYDAQDPTSAESYYNGYYDILNQVKTKNPNCKIILLEPFLLMHKDEFVEWHTDLDPKIQAVRKLAREFDATYIALDGLFAELSISENPVTFSEDGVHPTQIGHSVIAREWIKRVIE